ncbi:MAG: DGQHR domain-containing protein [bacterium]
MKVYVLPFDQPAGSFLLAAMPAPDIIRISRADPRKFDSISLETVGGIQREPSRKRILEIAEYSETVDASFPTPILLALDDDCYTLNETELTIEGENVADIVDGQHRVLGLTKSGRVADFVVPVVFILEATEEQKALIFATINGKQTKVPASIIYDLFAITKSRSPYKTAHEIARAMNNDPNSPWYRRLKMLGKKTPGSLETLSQGTFVHFLLPHISTAPDKDMDLIKQNLEPPIYEKCIFNEYFRKDQDSVILKVLLNVFQAARRTWMKEWDHPELFILSKTTGFSAIMRALPELVAEGKRRSDLSEEYFGTVFLSVKNRMAEIKVKLTSDSFSPSASGEAQLRDMILNELVRS